jgi:nitrilase
MTTDTTVRVAVVQAEPVWLDAAGTVEKTESLIADAAARGAQLVVFPETWIPGYPVFLWMGPVAWQMPFVARYHASSLVVGSALWDRLRDAARRHRITVVLGHSEKDHGTLYMGQAVIDETGNPVLVRRKVKPTHVERTLFGEGDGSHLRVIDSTVGRLGALCCWEHLQPLTKYAMYAQHEQVHAAAWPCFGMYRDLAYALSPEANLAATQTYALEGQCYVLAATQLITQAGVDMFVDSGDKAMFLRPGGGFSRIFGPDGSPIGEPLDEFTEGLVVADIDLAMIDLAKNAADPVGHYARPDVTRLLLNDSPALRVQSFAEPLHVVGGPATDIPEPVPATGDL